MWNVLKREENNSSRASSVEKICRTTNMMASVELIFFWSNMIVFCICLKCVRPHAAFPHAFLMMLLLVCVCLCVNVWNCIALVR